YFKGQLTTSSFIRHYSAVADACPVPVLLYNFSGLTGVTLPVDGGLMAGNLQMARELTLEDR
ncbi:MAG: hypothetical protein ABGW90_03720, partial [Martelella sp.]